LLGGKYRARAAHAMAVPPRIHQAAGCEIEQHEGGYMRAVVGPGLAEEVQECYRALANACVTRHCNRVLVVGRATIDPFYHLAGRDALRSMTLAGVAADLRIAFVAMSAGLIAVYDAAVVEAGRLGLEARRFMTEAEAEHWLRS
jgi:hypothetical protein